MAATRPTTSRRAPTDAMVRPASSLASLAPFDAPVMERTTSAIAEGQLLARRRHRADVGARLLGGRRDGEDLALRLLGDGESAVAFVRSCSAADPTSATTSGDGFLELVGELGMASRAGPLGGHLLLGGLALGILAAAQVLTQLERRRGERADLVTALGADHPDREVAARERPDARHDLLKRGGDAVAGGDLRGRARRRSPSRGLRSFSRSISLL